MQNPSRATAPYLGSSAKVDFQERRASYLAQRASSISGRQSTSQMGIPTVVQGAMQRPSLDKAYANGGAQREAQFREANFLKKYISKFRTILQLASGDRSSGEQAGSWERLISVKNDPEIHPSDLIGVITLEGWAMFLYHWQDRMWRLRSLGGLFKELAQLYLRHIPPSDNAHNYMACWICSYGESVTQCEVYKHISVAERQIVQDAGSAINRNPALSGGIVLAKSIALFNDRLAIPPLNYKAKSYEAKAIHLPRIEVSIQEARQSIASMKKDLKRLLQNCIEEAQGVAVSQPHQVQRARQVSIISQFMQNLA